jgi:uncharacterized coiled-coil protein SlyX
VTAKHAPGLLRTESELRAERLGFALRSLAADLADERRKVAQLRREIAELRSRLESSQPTQGGNEAGSGGTSPPESAKSSEAFPAPH